MNITWIVIETWNDDISNILGAFDSLDKANNLKTHLEYSAEDNTAYYVEEITVQ